MWSVPLVDLSAPDAAAVVDAACRSVGFLTVTGHGVPDHVTSAAWASAGAFFDLPLADRMAVVMPRPGYPYGYSPLEGETLAQSLGRSAAADRKESFAIGPVDPPAHRFADADEAFAWSPNLWPEALPSLQPAWETYYRELSALAGRLLSTMAVGLGLPDDWFDPLIDRHTSAMRALNYPGGPEDGVAQGASAHTDYGTLTILLADPDVGGLQVEGPDGEWHDVDASPGTFVVNLGDAMARWTNDRWHSTMHRVLVPARRRRSIAFFHNANWDATIECLPTCTERAAKYPPMAAGPHLMHKFRATVTPF